MIMRNIPSVPLNRRAFNNHATVSIPIFIVVCFARFSVYLRALWIKSDHHVESNATSAGDKPQSEIVSAGDSKVAIK